MDDVLKALRGGKFIESFGITHVEPVSGNMTESEKAEGLPKAIIVTVEAIHAGMTKNRTFYPADKLESSTHTWLTPYNKPVIKNHDTWEEPNGRVIDAYFKESVLVPEGKTIELKLRITDKDTIEKVLDGRYQTLSIGGSTNEARCSICAKNIVESGWCGHSKGKKYEGKEAYWIIGEMEFNEISWVNVPADVNARVIQIKREGNSAGGRKESVDANEIDNILNEGANQEPTDPTQQEEGAVPGTTEPGTTEPAEPATQQENEEPKSDAEKLAEALEKITELEESVSTLTTERDTLKTEKVSFEESKATFETTLQEKEQEVTLLKEERDNFRNKNIALAKTAHRYLAERAVDLRITLGEAEKTERDALVTEYAKTPAKVLESTIGDLLEKPIPTAATPRESTPVTNPGGTNQQAAQTVGDDGDITESAKGNEKPEVPDINVLAENLIAIITGKPKNI